MIDKNHQILSVRRQSELLSVNRSSLYIEHRRKDDSELCNMIAEIYADYPIYGYRRITVMLARQDIIVNHKCVYRLMRAMNLKAIYPGPNTSKRALGEMVYPYLLRELSIAKPHQVWQIDITYLRTASGFMYLVALIDVYSRLVVGWRLSNSLCIISCLAVMEDAMFKYGRTEIINSDQGSQFTSSDWINALQKSGIKVSMTGRGRSNDNAHIERLWRSFKYEGSYLYKWHSVAELAKNIPKWLDWYNKERPHQALAYHTPFEKYSGFMDKSYDLPTTPQLLQLQI